MRNAGTAVETCGVEAGYGGDPVLANVSCRVGEGDFVGVIGPNGAGKTTLLRVLNGTVPASAGKVLVRGRNVAAFGRRALSRIMAFVPPYLSVPVAFTVSELVAVGRTPYVAGWSPLSDADRQAIRRAMDMTDVAAFAERTFDELSAGEKQRVVLAMALAQEPGILLLDEPTAHLDIHHAWRLMSLVRDLNREQGVTVVLSSHDLNLAAEFCGRLLLMHRGRVEAEGPAPDVVRPDILSRVYGHPLEVLKAGSDQRTVVLPGR